MDPAGRITTTVDPFFVARSGASRLEQLVRKNGRFRYSFNPDKPDATKGYNQLRHCGTIWAMTEVANRLGPMPDVIDAATRAMEWLIAEAILPYHDGHARCVVEKDNVKLGGAGLAILALTELARAKPQQRYTKLACDLGEYILLQRRADGDFIHKRNFWSDKPDAFVSEYYTGEALFGLLRLHDATGDRRWFEEAKSSELRLAERHYGVMQQSHWMLYALEQFHRVEPWPLYREHARRIVDDIILSPAYRESYRSTPIACRSEGLLAYMRLCRQLPSCNAIDKEVNDCRAVVSQNLQLQLGYRQADGSFIRGGGSNEVRIDYIQHNISSFLAYGQLVAPAES